MHNEREEKIRRLVERMSSYIPHAAQLGICFERVEEHKLTLRMPWREELIGNPTSGAVHGGALTVLMDQAMGIASLASVDMAPTMTPTLDLRIDHLGVASARRDILATAWVYKATRKIIFVEGIAWCETPDRPIVKATGSFVRLPDLDLNKLWQMLENSE